MSLHIALVDLDEGAGGCKDKEQTGSFGSAMEARGLAGSLFGMVKTRSLRLPLLSQAYLAAIFRGRGHKVTMHRRAPEHADLVLMATSIVGWKQERDFARALKEQGIPKVGFTGAFAAAQPELFLAEGDFVVSGESEAWAMHCEEPSKVEGVVGNGFQEDIDALPFPDWHGFPLSEYGYWPLLKRRPFLTMAASRGCPHGCTYCHYGPAQGKTWRPRAPKNVIEELRENVHKHSVQSILFRDLVFTEDRQRSLDICQAIENSGLSIDWACETRPDLLDEELLEVMASAGLRAINLGIEAVASRVLESCSRRPVPWSDLKSTVKRCRRLGIRSNAFWILGFPRDDSATLRKRIDRAIELDTDLAQFCVLTPMPGTPFFESMKREDRLLDVDWSHYTTYNPVFRLDALSPEAIRRGRDEAYRKFFLRPSWAIRRGIPLLFTR